MRTPEVLTLQGAHHPWSVSLVPAWGASLTAMRYRHRGHWRALCRAADADALASGDRLRFSAWPLLPYSNRIPRGKLGVRFGKHRDVVSLSATDPRFPMPIHGSGWLRSWAVEQISASACVVSLDEPVTDWPWPFHAEQRIELVENALHYRLSLRNDGTMDMPAGIGWHPYFSRTPLSTLRMRLGWCDERDASDENASLRRRASAAHWDGITDARLSGVSPVDNGFGEWDGLAILVWPEWNLRLHLHASGALSRHCVLYSPAGVDFTCIEPVSHANHAPGAPTSQALADGIVRLAPGQCLHGEVRLTIASG